MHDMSQNLISSDGAGNQSIYGVVLNDRASLKALGEQLNEAPYKEPPQAPVLYIKPCNTVVNNGAIIELPQGEQEVEVGATLGLVAAKTMTAVSADEALSYLAGGYLVADLSLPHDSYYRPAIREKCFDGACPVADQIIPLSELPSDQDLTISIQINDSEVLKRNFNQQIRSSAQLLADVTEYMTLRPGDMLLIGVSFQAPKAKTGDRVRLGIDGLSDLTFTLSAFGGEQ